MELFADPPEVGMALEMHDERLEDEKACFAVAG